jgi:DnaJ-like protein
VRNRTRAGRRPPMRGRMPLVEKVLEMLWAALPSFEFDAEAWGLPGKGHRASGAGARAEPEDSRRRAVRGSPPPAVDPALQRYYIELGVHPGADLEAIRSAWRRLVREHHPDLHGADIERQSQGNERVKDLNLAYREIKRRLLRGG